ncbi:membrane protein [Dyella thiooxydans]|uniref:Probable membrane transporter protein n=1 Tax=Dyella thiooxydans TaxID=445710 RepID=A0A160N412_9GAMM|nr:sulfite exporter TauE/SafE family protein [Dyella thiooxydans]AND70318.1 membrane protein [Dyella thiooxydans]
MLQPDLIQTLVAIACGSAVGFSLALIGGGGSILAVPLLLYVVGVHDPHLAIGTSALAVAVNAFANLIPHARAGHVRWKAAFIFAATGVVGAFIGSTIGKAVNGQRLLVLFALLMIVVAVLMLRGRRSGGPDRYPLSHANPRLAGVGLGAGALSGFFGIGGGFLIVPGLMLASGMEIIHAIGTSLFAVGSFGLTAAVNYARSGLIDWPVAGAFIGGGVVGGWLGALGAKRLAKTRGALNIVFAGVIIAVAIYMLVRSLRG